MTRTIITVDGVGLRCVQVLLRLRRAMVGAADGVVFHVIADDPAAPLDLAAWCHMTGHSYLGPVAEAEGTGSAVTYALRRERGARDTAPARPWRLAEEGRGDR